MVLEIGLRPRLGSPRREPLQFTRLEPENWMKFRAVDVELQQRVLRVGPNASGKSTLLDAFQFPREVQAQLATGD